MQSVDDFYHVYSRNMHTLGSPSHDINWFRELVKLYQENILVGRVWHDNQIIGSGILIFNGDKVSIPWASTLREYNHLAPNMLLYWNLLRISSDKGCKVFDFGRSTFGEGTFKFKRQWGASPVLLDWTYLDGSGTARQMDTSSHGSGRKILEQLWIKMPLSIANFIGPKLRRHISL